MNEHNKIELRKRVSRDKLIETVTTMPVCEVVMEACGSSNYWASVFQRLGHQVKLIAPEYVKLFVKMLKRL